MTRVTGQYIDGEHVSTEGGPTSELMNPATGQSSGRVMHATEADIKAAISSAQNAFTTWSQTTPLSRARILMRFRELIEANSDALARLVTQEHGKTLADSHGSIARAVELIEFACNTPHLLQGQYSERVGSSMDCYTIRQPLGVCAGVSPFNFPVMVPVWQFAWAITCGNTFILKPSPQNPSVTIALAKLLSEAGCPPGVLNVLQGDKAVVDALNDATEIKTMTAVASTPVAKSIYEGAIAKGKRAHTFGGAKNHAVVLPDADMAQVASALSGAAYGSAGERCMALSVALVVGEDTADALVEQMRPIVNSIKMGDGLDAEVQMGPLISKAHRDRVRHYVDLGIEEGAELLIDGRNINQPGWFMGPCLFDHVKPTMRIYQEEIFGPVLCICRVNDYESALSLINEHPYGNGTAIFTADGHIGHDFASRVQVGMVGINVPIPVPIAYHRFGGLKQSFFGDIGMHGEESVRFYTQAKSVTVSWPARRQQAQAGYTMPRNS